MKIAFYKAEFGDTYDKTISIATLSKFSHCEIVMSDGECWSASPRDNGVRGKFISLGSHWEVFDIIGKFDEDTIKYWFQMHEGDLYDTYGAIGSLIHLDLTNDDKKFCSFVCAIVLGIDPIITPGGLYRKLKQEKIINV